jgi:hypothetical protein
MTPSPDLPCSYRSGKYQCYIKKSIIGGLCGYVGVDPSHPCYGKWYDDVIFNDIDVHGGLTFSGNMYEFGDLWFIGFDTNHVEDFSDPKDITYVRREIELLINQIEDLDVLEEEIDDMYV